MRSFSYTTFPCSCTTWLLPSYATTQPPSMSVFMAASIATALRHVKAGAKLTTFLRWPTVRSHHGRHHETAQRRLQLREAHGAGHKPPLRHEAALRAGRRGAEQPALRIRGGMKLAGRTAFISGASRNIGRAIALAFAAEGADLVLNTRVYREELEAVAAECRKAGVRVVPVLGDIADASAVEAMVKEGLAEFGVIDVLVCNAAIRPHTAVTETSLEDWHRVLGVNLHSAFYLARAVIPGMKERRRGSIIAIGGQSSLTGRPHTAAVTAAKTGLLGLVRALAAELGPFGIRANMVVPGTMDTERRYAEWYPEFRQAPPGAPEQLKQIPLGRLGRPEEIADACVFLASDASSYITGDEIRVMGGRIIG